MAELHLIAGPNGSGKSTFLREVRNGRILLDYAIAHVINPDDIAMTMNAFDPDASAIAAGREALVQREIALARGETFAIETTFSGHSERRLVTDAQALRYRVSMTYISLDDPDRNVARVIKRAAVAKRTVPPDVVHRRYARSLTNLSNIATLLDRLDVFDNSEEGFRALVTLSRGRLIKVAPALPAWAEHTFDELLKRERT